MTLPYTYRFSRSVPPDMLHNDPYPKDARRRSQPHGRHSPLDRLRVIPFPGLRSMRMMLVVMMMTLVLVLIFVQLLKFQLRDITLNDISRGRAAASTGAGDGR